MILFTTSRNIHTYVNNKISFFDTNKPLPKYYNINNHLWVVFKTNDGVTHVCINAESNLPIEFINRLTSYFNRGEEDDHPKLKGINDVYIDNSWWKSCGKLVGPTSEELLMLSNLKQFFNSLQINVINI